jgi:hypothetical protein
MEGDRLEEGPEELPTRPEERLEQGPERLPRCLEEDEIKRPEWEADDYGLNINGSADLEEEPLLPRRTSPTKVKAYTEISA